MKTKPPTEIPWPPAWQTERGTIVDVVLIEARKLGLAADEIVVPMAVADPRSRNQLMIAGRRCQVLPGRVLDPDEGHGDACTGLRSAAPVKPSLSPRAPYR